MENGSNSPSTAPSNPTPSTAPPPTTSLSQPALLESTGELEPGFYKRPGFAPPIAFEVGAGWSAEQLFDGFFDVQMNPGSPDVVAVQFARPESIFGMNGESTPASAEEAVRILGENPDLDVLETSESRMSGLVGSQVTVENSGTAHASVMQVPPGALGIDPGRRLWIAFFDTEDGLLAIMVGGSVAEWDAALLAAEPVLESVVLGD
jgi:hypothetical protein